MKFSFFLLFVYARSLSQTPLIIPGIFLTFANFFSDSRAAWDNDRFFIISPTVKVFIISTTLKDKKISEKN